jgi:DNA invertase Pin-like site-specific DNA recombinase
MKIAVYARVNTADKEQDPDTQLFTLRDYCAARGWQITSEYVDKASASDLGHRVQWRRLVDDAAKRRFNAVLVFKLDRAFRSVRHMHATLEAWELVGVSFLSQREGFDTTTPLGRLLMNLLAAIAEFELELIRDRVKAGMDRARRQGKRIGRPRVTEKRGFERKLAPMIERVHAGEISKRKAAWELGIGFATLSRLIQARKDSSHDSNGNVNVEYDNTEETPEF